MASSAIKQLQEEFGAWVRVHMIIRASVLHARDPTGLHYTVENSTKPSYETDKCG